MPEEVVPVRRRPRTTTSLNQNKSTIVWKNLNYEISSAGFIRNTLSRCFPRLTPHTKHILNDVCGYAEPGKFLAIIGPSGAGKTSLLNILSARVKTGTVSGDLTMNGNSISRSQKEKYKQMIGYVTQHDSLLPFLTVYETLLCSGMLTMPKEMSIKDKLARINEIIQDLGLKNVKHQRVGSNLVKGISGGEKKRLSIGIELLREPSILLLDEPTSGLDAKNALRLCESLSKLAHKYRYTIITTIHQPRAQIFDNFDLLLIMAGGGKQIYFGPANKTLDYFAKKGYECPVHENPADYFIDVVTIDYTDPELEKESVKRVNSLAEEWKESEKSLELDPFEKPSDVKKPKPKGAFFLTQIFWITYRGVINETRNPQSTLARVLKAIFLSLVMGTLFYNIDNDQSTINDRTGVIFFLIINISFNEVAPTLANFSQEREVFFRERDSRSYHITAYWIGRQLSFLFFQMIPPLIMTSIIYWMAGLQPVWYKFMIFFATFELVSLITGTVGMVLGSAVSPTAGMALAPLFITVSMLFSGFLVNLDNIPSFLSWIQHISYFKYAFDILIQTEFNDLKLTCDSDQLVYGICPITKGETVIDNLNISAFDLQYDFAALIGMVIFYRFLFLVALKRAEPTGN